MPWKFTSLTGYGSLYARGGLPACANAGCGQALFAVPTTIPGAGWSSERKVHAKL
ncbi:hypothetical protein [Paenibacillus sp. YSY-4.3]